MCVCTGKNKLTACMNVSSGLLTLLTSWMELSLKFHTGGRAKKNKKRQEISEKWMCAPIDARREKFIPSHVFGNVTKFG